MNIWDSVHRGLEKASQEAARIAKAQRLRTILDNTVRQLDTQQGLVVAKAMDLYISGKLPPGDLFAACQELHNLHQRVNQLQSELHQINQAQIQATGNANSAAQPPATGSQENLGGQTQAIHFEGQPTPYTSSPNFQPFDSAVPPPPPGVGAIEGQATEVIGIVPPPPPLLERNHCPTCHAALVPGNAFCHNCGTPIAFVAEQQQLTVRSAGDAPTSAENIPPAPVGQREPPEVIDEY